MDDGTNMDEKTVPFVYIGLRSSPKTYLLHERNEGDGSFGMHGAWRYQAARGRIRRRCGGFQRGLRIRPAYHPLKSS